ncbi:MAG: cupin domain-containing protein [Thermodesulfobacteriota bacterium]|nr:cupin domain-containing protein [Thermodesulfobacteriota bacterium]
MFNHHSREEYVEVIKGIKRKTLVYGKKTLLTEFILEKGKTLPRHSHSHEQTGYLVKGAMKLTIGETTFDVKPGDSWCIPGDCEHWAEIIQDSVAVEVFSPVREDYLPQNGL